MYESSAANPLYQSADLDWDAARAEWERQGEGAPERATLTDTPEQIARASISAYREYVERYGQSPDEAAEAAVREVTEGLAVDVAAIRAELAAQPAPEEMRGWPL
jgi:hypothetical protein